MRSTRSRLLHPSEHSARAEVGIERCDVTTDGAPESILISVADYSLAELAQVEHPVLVRALHRVLADAEATDTPVAAFDNFI